MSNTAICILTGASRGLGLAMARQLRAKGYRLLTLSRHPNPSIDGPGVEQWAIDLAQPAAAAAQLAAWVKALPREQVGALTLINNAADLSTPAPLDAGDAAEMSLALRVGLEALIETALGMANVEAIARFGGRLEALHFGVADFAASMRARTTNIGGLNPHYPGDQWHASISRMVVACRAYGLRAIDGPFGDFSDPEGYKDGANRAAALGCEGKWAIHPSQISLANEVFSPPEAEVTRARRIIEELRKAEAMGKGAAQLDGRMIDAASERMAMNVLVLADAIAAR